MRWVADSRRALTWGKRKEESTTGCRRSDCKAHSERAAVTTAFIQPDYGMVTLPVVEPPLVMVTICETGVRPALDVRSSYVPALSIGML